jgi:hypothetical protein
MKLVRPSAGVCYLGAVVALGGCAQGPSAYETKVAEITARHREAVERVAREAEHERQSALLKANRRQTEDRMIARMREPLAKFLAETPRSCHSPRLVEAASGPPSALAQLRRSGGEIDEAFVQRVGATMLDIGDAAQQAGCPAEARRIYDDALRTLVGSSYADLRLRAQFASAYITRNWEKWSPKPTQAASAPGGAHAMGP